MDRPPTSKPRGICMYYNTPRGCFAKECKFLHGETQPLTPYDGAKVCRYYTQGYCARGDTCWFRHVASSQPDEEQNPAEVDENVCCICLEKPTTYGLLGGCSHVFCIQCIRQWRDRHGKSGDVVFSGVTKMCPLCRSPSRFITPSSHFLPHNSSEKEVAVERYKASMARTPCRYFQETKSTKPLCPFGRDCFYKHVSDDGTTHIFEEGVEKCMRKYTSRRSRGQRASTSAWGTRTNRVFGELSATIEVISASLPDPWRNDDNDSDDSVRSFSEWFEFNLFPTTNLGLEAQSTGETLDEAESDTLDRLLTLTFAGGSEHDQDDDEQGGDGDMVGDSGDVYLGTDQRSQPFQDEERIDTSEDGGENRGAISRSNEDVRDDSDTWCGIDSQLLGRLSRDLSFPIVTPSVDGSQSDWTTEPMETWARVSLNNDWSTGANSAPSDLDDWTRTTELPFSTDPGPSGLDITSGTTIDINIPVNESTPATSSHRSDSDLTLDATHDTYHSGEGNTSTEVGPHGNSAPEAKVDLQHECALGSPESNVVAERQEPPFLTDGRGRVVWSSTREAGAVQTTRGWPRAGKARRQERPGSVEVVGDSGGFTTDGRGKVIGTSRENRDFGSEEIGEKEVGSAEEPGWHPEKAQDSESPSANTPGGANDLMYQ